MAGLMDLLFPYADRRERTNAIKDESMSAPQRRGLLDAMQLDTHKYMTDPNYAFVPGQNPRADIPQPNADYLTDPRYTNMPADQKMQAIDQMGPSIEELMARRAQLESNKDFSMQRPDWNTMSLGDKAGMIVSGTGDQLWQAKDEAERRQMEQQKQAVQGTDPRPSNAYEGYAKPRVIDEGIPAEAIPQVTQTPAQPVVDPQTQMIEQIKQQKAMLDQLYPQRSYDNQTQQSADAYALDARKRAAQMAQLAFFAGITNSAGGNWTAVGQGLMNAGAAYDQGFQRYQAALSDQAGRQQSQSDQKYTDEVNRTNSAVNLYQESQKLGLLKQKEMQDNYEKSRKEIMERFKTEEPKLGDYVTPEQQAKWDDWRKRFGASMENGRYIASFNDVSK
jgi:hypothetical protein